MQVGYHFYNTLNFKAEAMQYPCLTKSVQIKEIPFVLFPG